MTISAIDICNSAFDKIGVEPITSFSEDSKAARLANRKYEILRDSLLYDHYWNFAIRRIALAKLPTPTLGGGTAFQLPSDCLRPIRLISGQYYKIEGKTLITSSDTCNLKYVAKVADTSQYTPKFCEALAHSLASDWAYLLVQSVSVMDRIKQEARAFILDAASADAQEDYLDTVHSNTFLDSHFAEIDYPVNEQGIF